MAHGVNARMSFAVRLSIGLPVFCMYNVGNVISAVALRINSVRQLMIADARGIANLQRRR